MNKYCKILEFDKIVGFIANNASLDVSKEIINEANLIDDLDTLNHELDFCDEASVAIERIGSLPIHFSSDVKPVLALCNKNGVVSIKELILVMSYLETLRDIKVYLSHLFDLSASVKSIEEVIESLVYPKELLLRIKDTITYDGEVLDTASTNLKNIRARIINTENSIRTKLQELMSKLGDKLSVANITIRNDRFVLPIKAEYKSLVKGITHDTSSSGGTVYIEPVQVFELTNKISELHEEEKREIFEILKSISASIGVNYEDLAASYEGIIKLDIIFAKAKYSLSINGNRPNINKNGVLELLNAYHPLLNVETIVKNNIIMGIDYKGIIITGPNTGGKTVLLKTIGLLSLMVKFGLLIPASKNSNVMIFDGVYADIGDEQSIEANLSTFSSHLTNVIDIMRQVTDSSLVLLDELGSGTDPIEGSSLAIAIYDYLIERKCLIVATSHYPELKTHAYSSDDMINASVEFDEQSLKPTYRLLIGVPGMSNAHNIAKRLGLNPEVVKSAKEHAYNMSDEVNDILEKLIKQSRILDRKISEADNVKKDLELQLEEAKLNYKKAIEEHEEIIKKANLEAKALIEKKMREIYELIEEIDATKGNAALPKLAEIKHHAKLIENEYLDLNISQNHELAVGDNVFVKPYECSGKIIKVLNNDKFVVAIGNAQMTLEKDDLKLLEKTPTDYTKHHEQTQVNVRKSVSSSLDLRGKRYEEAAPEIDKFLDDCIYANLSFATIIHGFGTGTIRQLVHDKLNKYKYVKEYRYGGPNEGGQGVTVVTFKE